MNNKQEESSWEEKAAPTANMSNTPDELVSLSSHHQVKKEDTEGDVGKDFSKIFAWPVGNTIEDLPMLPEGIKEEDRNRHMQRITTGEKTEAKLGKDAKKYEIRALTHHRVLEDGIVLIKVRWKRYKGSTWQYEKLLQEDVPEIVSNYWESQGGRDEALEIVKRNGTGRQRKSQRQDKKRTRRQKPRRQKPRRQKAQCLRTRNPAAEYPKIQSQKLESLTTQRQTRYPTRSQARQAKLG
ncbi:hypothetical protein GGI35DRAFT_463157 [Trichoderma velutinum]